MDRRAAGDLADVCERHGAWLLAYGTLNGGFLSSAGSIETHPTA